MYYVTMTDKFMSGWGPAKNKTNKLVIACSTYERAEKCYQKAKNRNEMIYVNICSKKPNYGQHHYVSWHGDNQTPPDYQSWME